MLTGFLSSLTRKKGDANDRVLRAQELNSHYPRDGYNAVGQTKQKPATHTCTNSRAQTFARRSAWLREETHNNVAFDRANVLIVRDVAPRL